ncbi:hypothetical protein [Streptomyces sp. FIT100]|uniref:hypothetical protein n=1 Tax=Streptomyces sp. FIT100 TaxID=2837956 RepID=UPI0021C7A14E|nr:hypothetical protein [Streptomyces sp. FIT100]UUN29007.1 hypothetical protein KK483_23450 [Streptomyces sp. FIT100]
MSRETESSSSGPQGRGGAAYPSGTPPYGSRQYPSLHPTQDAPDERAEPAASPQPDEPKTETTLTTRIRINIPGSRPIPPVVMRTPMSDIDARKNAGGPNGAPGTGGAGGANGREGERAAERTGATPRPSGVTDAPAARGGAGPRAEVPPPAAEKPAEEKTSDWFAPRKAPAPAPAAPPAPSAPSAPVPGPAAAPDGPNPHAGPGGPGGPGAPGGPRGPRPGGSLSDLAAQADAPGVGRGTPPFGVRPPGAQGRPGPTGPTTGPASGSSPFAPGAGGGVPQMSDDTAVLTPQKHAGPGSGMGMGQGPGPSAPGGNVSGDTLTSGIPVVPSPEHRSPFAPLVPGQSGPDAAPWPPSGPGDFSAPDFPGPATPAHVAPGPSPSPSPAAPGPGASSSSRSAAKKGRSKLVLAGAGVFGVLVVAYGAGLLLNHSEVPKGTTVLGVDIGGGTKADAVATLESALGERTKAPLQLTVDGKKAQLAPDKAGLSLDSQATVRDAAGSDYNPVSVIGTLFGGERETQPVIPVDEEKLQVALADLAGTSGTASEGTIRFEPNKVIAVPGKAGKALDIGQSTISVRDAYRAQVETGTTNVVELPVGTREPTITKAELDRAMKEFAEPAMSGLVTIKAGGKEIQFGPARSLPKILSMKAIDGRLVEVYNKQAIDELLDGAFDGITITKGDGKEYPVSADDVASAMQKALLGKTPAERTQTIELNPQG